MTDTVSMIWVRGRTAALAGLTALSLTACEAGSGGPGIGTAGGAAVGAGAGRMLFGNSTTGMLIGAGVGGIAGNMALDRPAEQRRQQEAEASRDREMQRQLDFERQRMLQEEETRRQIEEQRLFDEWRRERYGSGG